VRPRRVARKGEKEAVEEKYPINVNVVVMEPSSRRGKHTKKALPNKLRQIPALLQRALH
jgi:hypothetical protein